MRWSGHFWKGRLQRGKRDTATEGSPHLPLYVSAVPVVFLAIAAMVGAGQRPYAGWVDAHRGIGELFGLVAITFLSALAFWAGFPSRQRIRDLTVLLVVV